jgi:hypothetical protein
MTTGGEARFEFRVWADRLDELGDRLRSLAEPLEVRESTDTYFVSTAAVDANPKARADLLDIKVLVRVREGFEQWGVRLKAEFPIDAALLRAELFPLLGLAPPHLEREEYSLSQLLAEVVDVHPDLAAVEVTKSRQMHAVDACIAEITDATIADREIQTVAVESTDLAALTDVRRALGLDGHDNVSYPRAIRAVLGGRFAEPGQPGGTPG